MRLYGTVGLAVIFLLIGFLIGKGFGPKAVINDGERTQESTQNGQAQQKLQALVDNEISDYYRLKSLEEKYKKADEILGKIVAIFLADLGIRVSQQTRDALQAPPLSGGEDRPAKSSPDTPLVSQKAPTGTPGEARAAVAATPAQGPNLVAEKRVDELRESDIEDFLAKTRIDDLYGAFRSVTGVSGDNPVLLNLIGKFAGAATVSVEGKNKVWDTTLILNLKKKDKKPEGEYRIILSENGKQFSNTSGEGGLGGDIREFSTGSKALLLRASPTIFLQVYYVKGLDSFIGNVYSGNESHQYETIGTLQLKRVAN